VIFLVITVLLINIVDTILANGTDNHKYLFREFHHAPSDEVDVVYMGPSTAGWNWNPTVAYHAKGIASQLLSSERHPPDAMPYLIKEASMKHPKLYIVDAMGLILGGFANDLAAVQSIIINLRLSKNRFDAAKDMLENYSDQQKTIGTFPLLTFHGRWKQLTQSDFEPAERDFVGFSMQAMVGDQIAHDIEAVTTKITPLPPEHLSNLNKVIKICRKLDGKILFVVTPNSAVDPTFNGYLKFVEQRVTQAGFDYVDSAAHLNQIGMDVGDLEAVHLTPYGAEKYTTWLSGYIAEKYHLPDRRQESDFQLATRYENEYERYRAAKVYRGLMMHKYLESIIDPRYSVLMAVRGEGTAGLNPDIIARLNKLGVRESFANRDQSGYLAVVDAGNLTYEQITESQSPQALQTQGQFADGTAYIAQSGGLAATDNATLIVNGVNYAVNSRGMNFVVYDNQTHKVIDSVAFDTADAKLAAKRGIPNIAEVKVKAADIAVPKAPGTSWNDKGNTVVSNGQALRVEFDDVQRGDTLALTLDGSDTYHVYLCRGHDNHIAALYTVSPPNNPLPGLNIHAVPVGGMDFDSVLIVPIKGDGVYSLGHLAVK
jgi:hypothetical protein